MTDHPGHSAAAPDPSSYVEAIASRGFTVIEDVFTPAEADELLERIDELFDELGTPFGENNFLGRSTRRIFNLLGRDGRFGDVVLRPTVLDVIEQVLDRQCLLSSLTAIEMQPGETDQPLHADDGSFGLAKPHPPLNCTAIWALTDFTVENGATRVVPGSHEADRNPQPGDDPSLEHAVMRKGSAVVYHGSLWHAGGANTSDSRRVGIVVNYCAGYARQEENQLLAVPRPIAAELPRRLQQMLGYGVYKGLLGHVEQTDPGTLLDPDVETDLVWSRIR